MKPPLDLQQKIRAAQGNPGAQGQQPLQISGNPESLDPVFAGAVNFTYDNETILLEFIAIIQHANQGRLLKRVALTHSGARSVAESILKVLGPSEPEEETEPPVTLEPTV